MFETLFGLELPLAVRFFLAFLISLGLFGAAAWAVLRFCMRRLEGANPRARLAVVDRASVDESRQLILLRRDNVEYLLMIGGPTDVVVEATIVRAAPPAAGPLPRAIPLAESGSWLPQPEAPCPRSRMEPVLDEPAIATSPPQLTEPAPRPVPESLVPLAEEIAAEPVPLRNHAGSTAQAHPVETRAPSVRLATETGAADQALAELAHRLDVLLLKPNAAPEPVSATAKLRACPVLRSTA